ncbi:conserved hypothetical protein [Mesorhizobium metallidurans STM 2683]|uniref:Uncharacterized protein n=1 Tax=Mesorhizobium metallidurans STM 2683 TaxID=1297569 RepID=M5EX50_9HYPH|nr:hypothetical protein [Mesorhizobium metallidurans]CCV08560.1 conserved hypothetical protein [Mesorhizobium metallidurans STM 2683]
MSGEASRLDLFGTDEQVAERQTLTAGPLSVILEGGNLHTISFAGVEVVRAINYLARDVSWGTYKAGLTNLTISEDKAAFEVAYDGLCAGAQGRFSYRMKIMGDASGVLTLEAEGVALADFPTNRTGFVVLHPSEAAGGRLTIRHSDGRIEETVFPEAISPDQPAFDISALTHEPAPGLICTVAMEGDAFEMEDQRNWTDASFKTYVRPLSKPRPYVIAKGAKDIQRVTVSIEAKTLASRPAIAEKATLTLGPIGRMPSMALFLDSDNLASARAGATLLGPAQDVIVRFDSARGHDAHVLRKAAGLAASIGARLAIEAILDAANPATEAKAVVDAIRSSEVEPSAVLVSPRREFKTRASSSVPPGERPISDLVDALRASGIRAAIGAGTPSLFTEFNRNPPTGDADFVFFGNAAIVHAADDLSVMETLSVYPPVIAATRRLCPGKPIWLGPCTIGMRHNPYGQAVAANPALARVSGAGNDPRHGALFGAAFAVGVAAQAASAEVDRLILASPTGVFGLVDDLDRKRPVQAVHAELSAAAGARRYEVVVDHPGIAAIAYGLGQDIRVLVANLTPDAVEISVPRGVQLLGVIDKNAQLAKSRRNQLLAPYRCAVFRSQSGPHR